MNTILHEPATGNTASPSPQVQNPRQQHSPARQLSPLARVLELLRAYGAEIMAEREQRSGGNHE